MRNSLIFMFVLMFAQTAVSQSDADSLRAYYIQEYPDKFFVWPVLKQRTLTFDVRDRAGDEEDVHYKPNNSFSMGLGFYVLEVAFEVTFAIPLNEKSISRYGETSARDLQVNLLTKKWGADVYYQKYSGFYVDDPRINITNGAPYPQRPDIDTRNFGLAGVYIFNHRKFSLRSVYTFAERQKYSGGSVILFGGLNSFKVNGDSAILRSELQPAFGDGADFQLLQYTTLGVGVGYSYSLIWRKFFVNATLGLGPAQQWVYHENSSGMGSNDISINTIGSVRVGIGYNNDRFFGGVGFVSQTRSVAFDDIAFANAGSTFRMLIGMRFDEFGIFKKRAKDFIPR